MRPFLLPVFFYAGQVNAAAETPGLSDSQTVALTELRALLLWSLQQLGILTDAQVCACIAAASDYALLPLTCRHAKPRTPYGLFVSEAPVSRASPHLRVTL